MGDPGQIEQVLLNLCVNARDAMPHGGRLVIETRLAEVDEEFVSRHVGAKPGHCLLLTVSDTGVGMDGATVSRIFEPFFTTKGTGKGTGLGLATVFGIVKQAGGYIWVESEPGRGTTFKIFLPLAGAPGALEPVDTASAPVLEGKETILVLEDEEIVRSLVRRVLGMRGYAVLEARSATEAAAIARRHAGRIHLLLTDVVMPEIDGPEAARMITLQRPDVRVLFMSGYSDGVIRLRGLPSADAAFIEKPFTPDGLAGKVRDVLDGRDPGFQ
jgi:CheY-like chemotaxis protein